MTDRNRTAVWADKAWIVGEAVWLVGSVIALLALRQGWALPGGLRWRLYGPFLLVGGYCALSLLLRIVGRYWRNK